MGYGIEKGAIQYRPNVVLLTVDTLRQEAVSSYGRRVGTTTNIDSVAASGLRFTQAITGGTWTQAAFPVLLTSSYASMYGGCLGRLAPERPSPVEALASNGYVTAAFSTNPHLSKATGYDRGFGHFEDLTPFEADPRLRRVKGGQHLLRSRLFHNLVAPIGARFRPARLCSSASDVTDSVCRWLDGVNGPFFAWAHYMDAHWPYHIEEQLDSPSEIAQAWQDLAVMSRGAGFRYKRIMTVAQRNRLEGLYERAVRYLDAQIGRLLHHIEALGHASDTIVVITADHGEEFQEHGRWGHWETNLFDEILIVPLIVRVPGLTSGRTIERQTRLLDLMPTILELCGCPMPDGVEGTSDAPLWSTRSQGEQVVAIGEMHRPPRHLIAARTESFKLVWDSALPDRPDLYNLLDDPAETRNVADLYPHDARRLQAFVDAHLERVAATKTALVTSDNDKDEEVIRRLQALGYVE